MASCTATLTLPEKWSPALSLPKKNEKTKTLTSDFNSYSDIAVFHIKDRIKKCQKIPSKFVVHQM